MPNQGEKDPLTIAHIVEFLKCYPQDESFETLLMKEEVVEFFQRLLVPLKSIFTKHGLSSTTNRNSSTANRNRIKSITKIRARQSIFSEFPKWQATPATFWEESVEPLQHISQNQADRLDHLRIFLEKACQRTPQFERQIVLQRFVCVSIYQSFRRLYPAIRIKETNVREFLGCAGVSTEYTLACLDLIRGGRSRTTFCQRLQADGRTTARHTEQGFTADVDFGPLFILEIPDQIWDRRSSLEGRDLDDSIGYLQSINVSSWSETSGARSTAKIVLDFHQHLLWTDRDPPHLSHNQGRKGNPSAERQRTTRRKRGREPQKDNLARKRPRTDAPNASPLDLGLVCTSILENTRGGPCCLANSEPAQSTSSQQPACDGTRTPAYSRQILHTTEYDTGICGRDAIVRRKPPVVQQGELPSGIRRTLSPSNTPVVQACPADSNLFVRDGNSVQGDTPGALTSNGLYEMFAFGIDDGVHGNIPEMLISNDLDEVFPFGDCNPMADTLISTDLDEVFSGTNHNIEEITGTLDNLGHTACP
ncbi:hypothetical protein HIM_11014 [Hirsutella minnesotensis 3608]|uniref:Uncharacterized protein n=1 Tax=Hirsutella minnesotensis 3608 TaxID=1043627 RepID=A0A0F7ZJE9_9HYPO|nr:hypothetical protein HIM_11014 [Hirsutella minnesotensis 3608]